VLGLRSDGIGKERIVTKSHQNMYMRLMENLYQFYKEYLDLDQMNQSQIIGIEYP